MATGTPSSTQFQLPTLTPFGQVVHGLSSIGVRAGAGALAGYMFSIISPAGGAIFGAVSAVANMIGTQLTDACTPANETAAKTTLYVASFIASLAAGIAVTTAIGFPLTTLSAIGLFFAMIPAQIVVMCAANCIGGCQKTRSP